LAKNILRANEDGGRWPTEEQRAFQAFRNGQERPHETAVVRWGRSRWVKRTIDTGIIKIAMAARHARDRVSTA
jgi:hypothetical protein